MTTASADVSATSVAAVRSGPPAPHGRRTVHRAGRLLALAAIAVIFLLPLRGMLRSQGPPMEEGFMLTFPERVLHGDVPNRDFLHLYGPGSLWALAAVFHLAGVSLVVERLVGLAQQVALVLAVLSLASPWGAFVATAAAATTALIVIPPIGLTALAWTGAVALGLWGLRSGLEATRAADAGRARRYALVAGVLFGVALLYRPDLIVAITAGSLALWPALDRVARRRMVVGFALGLTPYLAHVASAGFWPAFNGMVLDPVVRLRHGRHLPVPPSPWHLDCFLQRAGEMHRLAWPLPALSSAAQLTAYFFLLPGAVAGVLAAGLVGVRRNPASIRGRLLLAVGAFSAGTLPQAVQRPDSTHLAWVACVPVGFLVLAVLEALRRGVPRLGDRAACLVASVGVPLGLVLAIPHLTARPYADYSVQSFGRHRESFAITRGRDRVFYYGRKDAADALNALLRDVDRVAKPGDRLFVGPRDLRYTPYNDAFVYYLLPELVPATYYIEMDPGIANTADSGLAEQLASADVVVVSRIWEAWDEPNGSREAGSDGANRVLESEFCTVRDYGGLFALLTRCARRDAAPPVDAAP